MIIIIIKKHYHLTFVFETNWYETGGRIDIFPLLFSILIDEWNMHREAYIATIS